MRRDTQGAVLLVIGLVFARLTLTGGFQAYVKTGLRIPLLLASVTLAAIGALTLWRPEEDEHHDPLTEVGHGHGPGGPRIGLLLLAPVLILLLVAPAPLGAFAANRGASNRIADVQEISFPPLPDPVDGAVDLQLSTFLVRAFHDEEAVRGVPVRLVGFVAPDATLEGGYRLSRFTLTCCAADAVALQVGVLGGSDVPDADSWVEVVGVWAGEMRTRDADEKHGWRLPVIEVASQREIETPLQPYEY